MFSHHTSCSIRIVVLCHRVSSGSPVDVRLPSFPPVLGRDRHTYNLISADPRPYAAGLNLLIPLIANLSPSDLPSIQLIHTAASIAVSRISHKSHIIPKHSPLHPTVIPKVLQGVIPLGLQGDRQVPPSLTHCDGCPPQLMADGCPMTTLGGGRTGL